MKGRDVDDEAGAYIGVEAGVDDLEGAVGLDLLDSLPFQTGEGRQGKQASISRGWSRSRDRGGGPPSKGRMCDSWGEAGAGTLAILMRFSRVLGDGARQVSPRGLAVLDFKGFWRPASASAARLGGAASSGRNSPWGEVEDAGAEASGGHAEEGAAAGLFLRSSRWAAMARTSTVLSAGDHSWTGYSCIPP